MTEMNSQRWENKLGMTEEVSLREWNGPREEREGKLEPRVSRYLGVVLPRCSQCLEGVVFVAQLLVELLQLLL